MKSKFLSLLVAVVLFLAFPSGLTAQEPVKAWAAHEQRLSAVEKRLGELEKFIYPAPPKASAPAGPTVTEIARADGPFVLSGKPLTITLKPTPSAPALAAPPAVCPCPDAAASATTAAPAAAAGFTPPGPGYSWRSLPGVGYGWVHESVTAGATPATAPALPAAPMYLTGVPVILRGQTCVGGACYGGR